MSDRTRQPKSSWWRGPVVRWALLVVVVAVALLIALWPRHHDDTGPSATQVLRHTVSAADRAAARLSPCPTVVPGATTAGPLAGITLSCLADGRPASVAAPTGEPTVLNLWAYWCQPCAEELPALQQFARRAGSAVTVLTVHSDPNEEAALARLRDLDVHLPGVQDADSAVRAAVGAPDALPVSVLLRPDGTVAKLIARPFADADDIADTVAKELGVRV
jgi:thiol-disulfide isomerase/thioredoxin